MVDKLKRIPVKYIRDYIKKDYKAKTCCFICNKTDTLEIHHLYSLSELFYKWCAEKKIDSINTVSQIKELRILFEQDYQTELSEDNLYTLCKNHHERLHNIFGQNYDIYQVPKVKLWLEKQHGSNKKF